MRIATTKISPELSTKLKVVNVILTIFIVLLHVNNSVSQLPFEYLGFTSIAVPTFFAISSFLYFITFDFNNSLTSYKKKLKSRFRSLLVPFFLFNVLGLIAGIAWYRISSGEEPVFGELTWSNFPDKLYYSYFDGPLWYLRLLFEFVLIAPLFGWVIKRTKYSVLLVIPLYLLGERFNYYLMPYWSVAFFTGAYMAIYFDEITRVYNRLTWQKWAGMLSGIILLIAVLNPDIFYTLCALCPVALLLILSPLPIHRLRFLLYIAPYTFLIYALHIHILRIPSKLTELLGITSPVISLILSTALTILTITTLGILLRRNPRLFSLLNGTREIGNDISPSSARLEIKKS